MVEEEEEEGDVEEEILLKISAIRGIARWGFEILKKNFVVEK